MNERAGASLVAASSTRVAVAAGGRDRGRILVAAMLVSTFMAAVEVTVISTAMPTIVARLGGFSLFTWAFGVYLLAQAVTTPIYGRIADLFGRRLTYIGGTALFLLGSLACGLAWSMPALIAARLLQGLGGGALAPLATTIISDVTPQADRGRVLSWISGVWGIAAIVGPAIGALCVNTIGWPFVFWINLPVGAATITLVAIHLRGEAPANASHRLDPTGALLMIVAAGAVMLALVQFATLSAFSLAFLLILGAAAGFLLYRHERHADEPIIPVVVLRNRMVVLANLSALLGGAMLICLSAFLPTWVQGVAGANAVSAGTSLGCMALSWTGVSIGLGRHLGRMPTRRLLLAASGLLCAGSLGLVLVGPGTALVWVDLGCIPLGAGLGVFSIVFIVSVQAAVEGRDRGRATSLFYFSRLIGQALGAASFGGILNAGLRAAGGDAKALVDPVQRALLPPETLRVLALTLHAALHGVFLASSVCALAMLAIALAVRPRVLPV